MRKTYGDLIIRLFDKENEAFEIIYNETKHLVFSMIYPIVGNFDVTEDLIQDTYIKMLNKLDKYNFKKPFTPWLAQIAKNIAYDYLRKIQKEKKAQKEIHKIEYQEQPPEIEMDTLLKELSKEKRNIVIMRTVANISFREISAIQGKPIGTIYSIYKQAIKELKQKLRKEVRK